MTGQIVEHDRWLYQVAGRFLPGLDTLGPVERAFAAIDVAIALLYVPLGIVGLVWLASSTDPAVIIQNWPILALYFVLSLAFMPLTFTVTVPVGADLPGSFSGDLSGMIDWAVILLFGPSALWLPVIRLAVRTSFQVLRNRKRPAKIVQDRWTTARIRSLGLATDTVGLLAGLSVFQAMGGTFPLAGLTPSDLRPFLAALVIVTAIKVLLMVPYITLIARASALGMATNRQKLAGLWLFVLAALGLAFVLEAFGPLVAASYVKGGLYGAGFLALGLLLVSALAHQLSRATEKSQNRSRELAALEQLAKAIMAAPLDGSQLEKVLGEHVPNMFRFSSVEIRLWPDRTLFSYRHSADGNQIPDSAWRWLHDHPQSRTFGVGAILPWSNTPAENGILTAPVFDVDPDDESGLEQTPIGALYLTRIYSVQDRDVVDLLPAAEALVDQVQIALYNAVSHKKALALQRVDQELAFASRIQNSFLPESLPNIPGWEVAAALEPARQTSGDFYDFFPLPGNKWGILVADVADKGVGAALYMALTRTLIRTYAESEPQPSDLFARVNRRLLTDSRADQFVTAFYAELDPASGTLNYVSAGHNPALWLGSRDGQPGTLIGTLAKTGIPLGMFEESTWRQETIILLPGDRLTIYTDGLTEAQNSAEDQFGESRLIAALQADPSCPANVVECNILAQVKGFIGTAAQFDDITLLVLVRDDAMAKVSERTNF